MDFSTAAGQDETPHPDTIEQRSAPRFVSLIRAAKLVSGQGEFVCVIRDVSATGVNLRTFHDLPADDHMALELQNGETYELVRVRSGEREASFTFERPIEVERLIRETWKFPKRPLRLNIAIPLTVSTVVGNAEAVTENLSQQGARVECDSLFAIDQTVRVQSIGLPEICAKVRWRKNKRYGLVFDNTFTLRDFAMTAAQVQCPRLLGAIT